MILSESDDAFDRDLAELTRPAAWPAPVPRARYDLVVIGAGPAGLVCAVGAAGVGARVALVERYRLGGDCLHFGCVPSKALIRAGRAASAIHRAGEFGMRVGEAAVDFAAVMKRLRGLRSDIAQADRAERFAKLGIDVFFGQAGFAGEDTIRVGGNSLRFVRAVIATGARPVELALPQLAAGDYFTNETIFNLKELPRRLLVVGGGPIGCELAQAFARLGSIVHLIQRSDRLLPREEPEASAIIQRELEREGVKVYLNAAVTAATRTSVTLEQAGQRETLEGDALLAAIGRRPNVEALDLASAGIERDTRGVRVCDRLRTTNHRVYAAGDVCSALQYTHAADAMARLVIRNALFFGRGRWSRRVIPHCTYTDPEVASVGLTVHAAAAQGIAIDTVHTLLADNDRARLDGETAGFASIHLGHGTDRIVGATLVASHAGEMIGDIVQAMTQGLGLRALAGVVRPYPTQAEVWKKLADAHQRTRLTPLAARLLRGVLRLRRRFG